MNKKGAIGILGGMGPYASSFLYKRLIQLSVSDFNAKNNNDFPKIILSSIPVPDFISNEKKRGEALEMLREEVLKLNNFNPSSF